MHELRPCWGLRRKKARASTSHFEKRISELAVVVLAISLFRVRFAITVLVCFGRIVVAPDVSFSGPAV